VAADNRQGFRRNREIPGEDVIVGVAEARRGHLDQQFVLARRFEVDLNDLPFSGCAEQGCGFGSQSSSWWLTLVPAM
jgi:hypothetical protein